MTRSTHFLLILRKTSLVTMFPWASKTGERPTLKLWCKTANWDRQSIAGYRWWTRFVAHTRYRLSNVSSFPVWQKRFSFLLHPGKTSFLSVSLADDHALPSRISAMQSFQLSPDSEDHANTCHHPTRVCRRHGRARSSISA